MDAIMGPLRRIGHPAGTSQQWLGDGTFAYGHPHLLMLEGMGVFVEGPLDPGRTRGWWAAGGDLSQRPIVLPLRWRFEAGLSDSRCLF